MTQPHTKNETFTLPNVLIGGTHKAGTTSLFRYLADHPDVCASSVKETSFFFRYRDTIDEEALRTYSSYFSHCSPDCLVRIEASPGYLANSQKLAKKVKAILPDSKFIFILREPTSRLISFFRSNQNRLDPRVMGISFEEFVDKVINVDQSRIDEKSEISKQFSKLREGIYADYLDEFLAHYPSNDICVVFFENLSNDTVATISDVCDFLNIDSKFYQDYAFTIENKTRNYRSTTMHRTIFFVNSYLEPVFNKFPKMRRSLRHLYHTLNEAKGKSNNIAITTVTKSKLDEYYASHNTRLRKLLIRNWPEICIPSWLKDTQL